MLRRTTVHFSPPSSTSHSLRQTSHRPEARVTHAPHRPFASTPFPLFAVKAEKPRSAHVRQRSTLAINNPGELSEIRNLFKEAVVPQVRLQDRLERTLQKGINKYNRNQRMESLDDFKTIVQGVEDSQISLLSNETKRIVASAYAHMADVLSWGTSDDQVQAHELVHKALKLDPSLALAQDLARSLDIEKAFSQLKMQQPR